MEDVFFMWIFVSRLIFGETMTETEANEMGIVELFQRVVLMNEKVEDVPRQESV